MVCFFQLGPTVAGMCSCRQFRAGMVFCQIQVKGRNYLVTIKLLNGSGKKTMEACALAGSPSNFVKVAGVVPVQEI